MRTESVYMRTIAEGSETLTSHTCWDAERFKDARTADAAQATGKGKPTTVEFLTRVEFKTQGGK